MHAYLLAYPDLTKSVDQAPVKGQFTKEASSNGSPFKGNLAASPTGSNSGGALECVQLSTDDDVLVKIAKSSRGELRGAHKFAPTPRHRIHTHISTNRQRWTYAGTKHRDTGPSHTRTRARIHTAATKVIGWL